MLNTDTPAGSTSGQSPTPASDETARGRATDQGTFELPAKLRVHALAKLLGASSREIITTLESLGESVRSAQSNISRDIALQVVRTLRPEQLEDGAEGDDERSETGGETTVEAAPADSGDRAGGRETAEAGKKGEASGGESRDSTAALNPVFAAPQAMFLAPEPQQDDGKQAPAAVSQEESDGASTETEGQGKSGGAEPGSDDEQGEDGDHGGRRRRRRGRRGRGRGRGADGDQDSAEEFGSEGDEDKGGRSSKKEGESRKKSDKQGEAESAGEEVVEPSDSESKDDGESGSSRRRRRRRRKGSSDDESNSREDDPPNTVVHVRESAPDGGKQQDSSDDEVRAIKGSTRLEAKRQRRRDGREAGRRRAPVLSESEFLARRESVERKMVVRENGDQTQIAVLEDNVLVENFVTSAGSGSLVGNVYLGRVQNVLPSMEAAFVDIGRGRNAVLYAGEVDWDAAGLAGKARRIEQALSTGDSVLVQVTKDPVGHKGARLTTQISLPGRFLVYVPGGGATGISRKLPDNERKRLKEILKRIVPENAGVIIRTASEGTSEGELDRDVRRLQAQWEVIKEKADTPKAQVPQLLYEEPDLLIKVVRDLFTEDFTSLTVQGGTAWETIEAYVTHVAPDLVSRLTKHTGKTDVFTEQRISEQISKALDRKVWLPSGGYLVIDRTEAMTVIDVNTGKFTGSGGNLEETVTRNNLEAAEEIVRQLRLRDIGGIIVIDFIDMVLESNRDLVLRRLTECLGRDRTRHQVAEVTSLGLVQMTRKRVGTGLLEAYSSTCEQCRGRGLTVSMEPVTHSHGNGGPDKGSDKGQDRGGSDKGSRRKDRDKRGKDSQDSQPVSETAATAVESPSDGRPKDSRDDRKQAAVRDQDRQGGGRQVGADRSGEREQPVTPKQDVPHEEPAKAEEPKPQGAAEKSKPEAPESTEPPQPTPAPAAPAVPEREVAEASVPRAPAEPEAPGEKPRRRKVSRPAGSAGAAAEPIVMSVPAAPPTDGRPAEDPAPAATVTRRRGRAASRPAGPPVDEPESEENAEG
jgi:ribonuclease E